MHPLFQKATGLTETIIGSAIEVHRDKGPGLIDLAIGLLINFHEMKLTDGVHRLMLPGANR